MKTGEYYSSRPSFLKWVEGYLAGQGVKEREVWKVLQKELWRYRHPALHRLENRGFLAGDWKETESGREAKFYRLTRKGRKQLETEAASWQRLIDAIALILGIANGGAQ